MTKEVKVRPITIEYLPQILKLVKQLNPTTPIEELEGRQTLMFTFNNYMCFGMFLEDRLIGVSSGWTTIRLYSGKQLEIDNVIIDGSIQSKGYGKRLISEIESWAIKNGCKTVELHTYVQNDRSHKFYFNQGYKILGFHFQKTLQ